MIVQDVLKVINGYPLSKYPWGDRIVEIVNAYVDRKNEITIECNKAKVYEAINTLPHSVKNHLLKRSIESPIETEEESIKIDVNENNQKNKSFHVGYLPYGPTVAIVIISLAILMMSGMIALRVSVEADRAYAMPRGESGIVVRYVSDILLTLSKDMSKTEDERVKKQQHRYAQPPVVSPLPSTNSTIESPQKPSSGV